MSGPRILAVDDEPEILRALRVNLAAHGYDVATADNGRDAIRLVEHYKPDVIVLDLVMPDTDGLEVCRKVREWSSVPIIVLSVMGRERDKVTALDLGADDYLTKPFAMGELLARVRVALRHVARAASGAGAVFATGDLRIDFARRLVTVRDEEVHLTPTEYELLKYLASNAGKILTHRMILKAVWGPGYGTASSYLRFSIMRLRRKLEPDPGKPRYILTDPGVGYRLNPQD